MRTLKESGVQAPASTPAGRPAAFPLTLPPAQYEAGAAAWLQTIYDADGRTLQASFQGLGPAAPPAGLTFSLAAVAELVSAVGVSHIKARFVILADAATGAPGFTLVLFASDKAGKRLSAYYQAEGSSADSPAGPVSSTASTPGTVGHPVANVLAAKWARAWAAAPQVETAMFDSAYGPLNGYTFEVGDFLAPFFGLDSLQGDARLHLHFGLREYARATAGEAEERAATFALTVQLATASLLGTLWGDVVDLGNPCPPF